VLALPRVEGFELRLLEERDADELYDVIDRHRAYLARWLPWPAAQTPEATLEFVRTSHREYMVGDGMNTAIVVDGAIAGVAGVHAISRLHLNSSVGYWLAEDVQGRGIVTAAVRAYVDAALGPWGLYRVELRAAVENARSRAVARRLGFVEEGVARQAERIGDRRHDLVVYSALAPEWSSATIAE
jgi:ribosomal-protein-serine acetyltransferase